MKVKIIETEGKNIKSWASILEEEALNQTKKLAQMPFIHSHVALMPDAHCGKGSTVGTVIATKGAIIPAAVGVDIGCGMRAIKLNCDINRIADKIKEIRSAIEEVVPVGFSFHQDSDIERYEIAAKLNETASDFAKTELHKFERQLGTLGGGNHFIEICRDQNDIAWLLLHSGSRGIGNKLATYHIDNAKELMLAYFISLPDPDLAYFASNTVPFKNYIHDLLWSQKYAYLNRELMAKRITDVLLHYVDFEQQFDSPIDCHHNYTSLENHFGANVYITRKGAVSAKAGQFGIIPGSMGTKSYIVKGKGNLDSFCSCSHGAGRIMSRTKARNTFTIEDFEKQTLGVECKKDIKFVDEIPSAYKDIDTVMNDQTDLVDIVYTLKQIMCIKG